MITDHEAEEAYLRLLEIVRQAGFGHIADELIAEVQLGKVEAKRVKVSDEDGRDDYLLQVASRKLRTKMETFTGTVAFTAGEKLNLIIVALERATIELSAMHRDAATLLFGVKGERVQNHLREVSTLKFTGIGRDGELISDPERRRKFSDACAALTPLLKELKESLHATT